MVNDDLQATLILVFGIIAISAVAGASGSIIVRKMSETMISSLISAITLVGLIGTILVILSIINLLED